MTDINLDMEQECIVQEIIHGQAKAMLVAGGPGTGKSLLAKKAYEKLSEQYGGSSTLYLVYNKPLAMFLGVETKASWFYRQFNISYKTPEKDKELLSIIMDWAKHEKERKIDPFSTCHRNRPRYEYIIVDEAQDFSLCELLLLQMCAKHLICFIDPNQAYTGNKTEIGTLLSILNVEAPYYLTKNYRNTQQIFDAASLFLNTEQKELRPSRFAKQGDKPIRFSVSNYEEENNLIADIISKFIPSDTMIDEGQAKYAPYSSQYSIGILAPNKSLSALYEGIKASLIRKGYGQDEPECILQKYSSSDNRKGEQKQIDLDPDPDEGKCTIIGYNVVKGLEFDVVIMPRITRIRSPSFVGNEEEKRNHLLYTAMTRARKELILIDWPGDDCYSEEYISEILNVRTSPFFQKG